MEQLALEVFDLPTAEDKNPTTSKFAMLEEDASITITDTSEIFASGDVWSFSFRLNARANAHIMGSVADLHGSRLHDVLDHRRARLYVEGVAIYLGYLRLSDEADIDSEGNIDVSFESGQKTFDEMIEGAKANQVPMMDDVLIGVALWRKRWTHNRLELSAHVKLEDGTVSYSRDVEYATGGKTITFERDGEVDGGATQEYPRMVFPKGHFTPITEGASGDIDCINTDYPYDDSHPYCNVALCYQRSGYERKMENGSIEPDYSQEPEPQRGYEVMPADRVNSAPNFYVIYWIKALMKHLGIYIEENQMMDVEDLRRLFFVNTKCAYKEPKYIRGENYDRNINRYNFSSDIRLVPEYFGEKKREEIDGVTAEVYDGAEKLIKPKDCGFTVAPGFVISEFHPVSENFRPEETPVVKDVYVQAKKAIGMSEIIKDTYEEKNNFLHDAIATSECFPDVDISEVINAVESGFGVRLLFSDDYKRVRIVLLRNVFRDSEIQEIACEVLGGDEKTENSIRGFRMTYGNTEDTQFYYKGFADKLPHKKPYFVDDSDKHDYSHWDLNADYGALIHKISAFDKTCYVTPITGNSYIIKVDKDAKRYEDLHPSLFEAAGYMDAEDGDCSGDEETIHEISLNFTPAIMNDVNFENERNNGEINQSFALFVDATMRPRRPDLDDNVDYNSPDTAYFVDGLPEGVTDRKFLYEKDDEGKYVRSNMMADEGIIKPGEFAITSDTNVSKSNLKTEVCCSVWGYASGGSGVIRTKGNVIATITNIDISGHINEGYRLYLQDNYEPNDDGVSPIEAKDWGLTLGIMRGSGSDAYVDYSADPDDHEENDTWEKVAGSSVTSHPDTCDSYGKEWDYNGSMHVTPAEAPAKIADMYPDSDAPFNDETLGYITETTWLYSKDNAGVRHVVLIATAYSIAGTTVTYSGDIRSWSAKTLEELIEISEDGRHMIIEVDSSQERGDTLVQLCALAYGGATEPMIIDDGVGSRYGRFSLKLRAEKLNPYFDPKQAEGSLNPRYLPITSENLRQRGLIDAFYKEYSYWLRNARVCKRTVHMTLADLLKIDKTKKVHIGDITGFIRKIQYSVSKKTGLGMVSFEIMYI